MESNDLSIPAITNNDLLEHFSAANTASIVARRNYHAWTGADLSLVVAGTLLLSVETTVAALRSLTGYGAAICFIVSWFSTIVILKAQCNRVWYGARAIAETVKALSWKYMTCKDPFTGRLSAMDADEILVAKLLSIFLYVFRPFRTFIAEI